MNAASVFYLSVHLYIGGPLVTEGPYTDEQCVACGLAWEREARKYAARNPQLYPDPYRWGITWGCGNPIRTPAMTLSNMPKRCEGQ